MNQLEQLLPEQKQDLNSWYDIEQQEWIEVLETICHKPDNNSPEILALLEAETRWEAERDYYHHQYYQTDRFF
ncbi:MAG TPA: hypothetical protein DCL61_24970 [Cyanobacteria bacterium UBA12227]|nr:hypothetical protein [Cyanobacteria bacterium UBA12227]HAX87249.1 hypothetical protein [Cyanobacteria bacterium UBA11370]HBY75469.1 hypothetical protein [Cyanobacteria bacterium UBA11148]